MLVPMAGGVAAVVATPWILGAAGFTSAGKSTFFPVLSFLHYFEKQVKYFVVCYVMDVGLDHRIMVVF